MIRLFSLIIYKSHLMAEHSAWWGVETSGITTLDPRQECGTQTGFCLWWMSSQRYIELMGSFHKGRWIVTPKNASKRTEVLSGDIGELQLTIPSRYLREHLALWASTKNKSRSLTLSKLFAHQIQSQEKVGGFQSPQWDRRCVFCRANKQTREVWSEEDEKGATSRSWGREEQPALHRQTYS